MQGILGTVANIPGIGTALKPLTDALSGLFGGQQGGSNVQSAMDDYSNGSLDGNGLFNAVDNSFTGASQSDSGGPLDQLKQFLADPSQSDGQVDGNQLMKLLQALQGSSGNAGTNAMIDPTANAAGNQAAIPY